jgi:hypothetical protein
MTILKLSWRNKLFGKVFERRGIMPLLFIFRPMKKLHLKNLFNLLLLLPFLVPSNLFGQRLAAFEDDQRFFYVYDNGVVKKLEYLPVESFHVGGKYVAYIDNLSTLQIYYNGEVFNPERGVPDQIVATDHLMAFRFGSQIKILEGTRFDLIESWAVGDMGVGDSIIAYHNNVGSFKCWYNDSLWQLDEWEVRSFRVSDNILCYVDRFGYFKVFYHGQVYQIEDFPPEYFIAGRDMIAYVDNLGGFRVFDHGEVYDVTAYPINKNHIEMPDGMVLFRDDINRTMIFKDGSVELLLDQEPKQLWVNENIFGYLDQSNDLYVYYQDEVIFMDRLVPSGVDLDNDLFVYTDIYGRLQGLVFGEKKVVSEDIPKAWAVYNQVVAFTALKGMIKFFDKDKTITFNF